MGLECFFHFFVFLLIADDYGVWIELQSLTDEEVGTVVGGEELHFKKIAMLSDDVKCLSSDRAC